jgi:hypothetical protein
MCGAPGAIIHAANPEIVEERKWVRATSPGTPVSSRGGIVCTGETYKDIVKMTFAKGAALPWELHERARAGEFSPAKPHDPSARP